MTSKQVRNLPIVWTSHLASGDKSKFEESVRNILNTPVLNRLTQIIEQNLKNLENSESSLADYDNPSWSHKQAHRNGVRQGYLDVLKLLK